MLRRALYIILPIARPCENGRFGRSSPLEAAPTVGHMDIPILAGTISTVVFAVSNLPMLRKALRTRDVSSYSLTSLVMINAANVAYSLYVFTLPFGPIWALHTFYLVSCAVMLVLFLRQRHPTTAARVDPAKGRAYGERHTASPHHQEVRHETTTSMPARDAQVGGQTGLTGRTEISRLPLLRQDY